MWWCWSPSICWKRDEEYQWASREDESMGPLPPRDSVQTPSCTQSISGKSVALRPESVLIVATIRYGTARVHAHRLAGGAAARKPARLVALTCSDHRVLPAAWPSTGRLRRCEVLLLAGRKLPARAGSGGESHAMREEQGVRSLAEQAQSRKGRSVRSEIVSRSRCQQNCIIRGPCSAWCAGSTG